MTSRLPALILVSLATISSAVHAKVIRTVEKTFAVQAVGQLRANTEGGTITVNTDDGNSVRIVATQVIDANSESDADKILEKLKLSMEQSGNDVSVRTTYEKRVGFSLWGNWPPVQVSYAITLPRKFNADLTTLGGDISVSSLQGSVRARTSGGNLNFDRMDGDLDGATSGGNVELLQSRAKANLSTSGGNITVRSATQLAHASTSGGNIEIQLTEAPVRMATFSTSGGNISLQVPKSAAWTLDAETSGGEVGVSGLALDVTKSNTQKSRLAGNVNGGGQTLVLKSSGGDIRVRPD